MKNSESFRAKNVEHFYRSKDGAKESGCPGPAVSSTGQKRTKRIVAALGMLALCFAVTFGCVLPSATQIAFADDLVDTVPSYEKYQNKVHTYNDDGLADTEDIIVGNSPYARDGNVRQSTSTSDYHATTFAAGLPLSTIYIDQDKVKDPNLRVFHKLPSAYSDYITYDKNTGRVNYDAANATTKIYANKVYNLNGTNPDGGLFYFIFRDAAVLPDGTRADLKITYSNVNIVIDQRYAIGNMAYNGEIYLATGASFSYGGTDKTDISQMSDAKERQDKVNEVAKDKYDQAFSNNNMRNPMIGKTMDATYQIVDKNESPINGTFIYAICGINLDRDPYRHGGNNYGKPLWYVNDFEGGSKYHFFSEAMSINGGQASQYIYVRSNNNDRDDNNEHAAKDNLAYYYPQITKEDGKTKFIGNAYGNISGESEASDTSYCSGFVTLADAGAGFKVTASGHGGYGNSAMNSNAFSSSTIWYRYTSGSGPHGRIETTSEGNWGGKLNKGTVLDGGTLSKPDTYVVAEGKTVTYTMTPDTGYKIKKLTVNEQDVKYNGEDVKKMKKGDTVTVTTAAGHEGILKYEEDGTYTFKFVHAEKDEKIFVEWEPTTADLLTYKIWDDANDADGMRKGAYGKDNWPKVKLQQSLDGGASWTDVTKNAYDDLITNSVKPQEVPTKTDSSGNHLDGTYDKNNDTTGDHPFTWEYLPVYKYDSDGRADRVILYRLVEGEAPGTDPTLTGYKSPQYADGQSFYLTSEVSKTWDGWLIYTDGIKEYVRKDGVYYDVDDKGHVTAKSDPQPDPDGLHTLDAEGHYRTADKALPYQSVSVKNEHTVSDIYIDVTKFWNDAYLYDSENHRPKETGSGTNEYDRRNITLTLHGTIDNGETVVDLAPDDPETNDLKLVIRKDEDQTIEQATGDKKIEGHTVYKDSNNNLYALVEGDSSHTDGLYRVIGEQINYEGDPITGPTDLKVVKNGDGTYRINGSNYGARFENLQAYHQGQLIDYTVTESFSDIDSFTVTGGKLTEKKDGSTIVGYTMSDLTRVPKDGDLAGYTAGFVNTPIIDDKISQLPVKIKKKDAYTGAPLNDAVFTVYTDPFNKVEPATSTYKQIENYTVLKDGQENEYVLKSDGYYNVSGDTIGGKANPQPAAADLTKVTNTNYRKVGSEEIWTDKKGHNYVKRGDEYYEVDADGIIFETKADPQPAAGTLSRIKTSGEVDEIRVITDASGEVTVNFNKTGTYYIVETGSPEGYTADTKMYKFEVDKKLNQVKLISTTDEDHETKWWQRIFDLFFGEGTNKEENWQQQEDKMGGTLTVKDTPLISNVLVRKIWDDAGDQDGKRPSTEADLPKVILQYTTDLSSGEWKTAQVYDSSSSALKNVDEKQVTHGGGAIHSSADNAYTWNDLPAYRDGKVVYYRVSESGSVLDNGTYTVTSNKAVSTQETVFTLVDDSVSQVNRIVDVTNSHTPQILTINATKHWNDNSNAEHKRPGTLKITLYRIVNGEESKVSDLTLDGKADDPAEGPYYETAPSADGNDWNAVFRDLPAFAGGSPVTYRLEETLTDGDKVNYVNSYSVSYTDTEGQTVNKNNKDSVVSSDVKRTFEDKDETIRIGETTYDVYIKDGTKYVRTGTDSNYTYYEIKSDGTVNFNTPADPQPADPAVSKIRVETTAATLKVDNVLKNNIKATKYWIGGANANVRFTLYRTSKENPTPMETVPSLAVPIDTGNKITVDSVEYETFIHANGKTYVDKGNKWHEVTGKGTDEDPYKIATDPSTPMITTWTPFKEDGKTLKDGWEKVDEHLFVSSAFTTSLELPGDDETHVFEDLPQMDANGNKYTYRVLETTTAGAVTDTRFEGNYSEDGLTVTNINKNVKEGSADVDVLKDLKGRPWDARYNKTGKESDKDVFYFWIEPVKGVSDNGDIIEFGPEEKKDKDEVPLPGDGKQYGRAVSQNTAVGTTSREVSFSPILYKLSDVGGAGQSKTYYYKVYEATNAEGEGVEQKDGKGITYDGTVTGSSWNRKTAVMKVVATASNDSVVTTEHFWEEISPEGTVDWVKKTPVFRNTYTSGDDAKVWIEKNVASRKWVDFRNRPVGDNSGDAYQFTIVGVSGAHLNTPGSSDDSYTTMPLVSDKLYNPNKDLQQLSTSELAFGVRGNPYTGDMLGDDGEEYYIYEIFEKDSATSTDDTLGAKNYTVDNIKYDNSKIYAKLHVWDNWDGTLGFEVRYYTDASCKAAYEITDHKVWIEDRILADQYVLKNNPEERISEERYNNLSDEEKILYTKHLKRLLSKDEASEAAAMTPEQQKEHGYRQVNAAYFTNYESVDIPVTKEWEGPAIEDVTVHLEQHLFPLSDEAALDGTATTGLTGVDFVKDAESKGGEDFWQKVGYVKDLQRGDFLNPDGSPKINASKSYTNIEGFNKDLPKYVVKGGTTYRAVYKLVEDDTSDTYTTEYGPQYYINRKSFTDPSKGLIVKNTVVATNTANIAAVKQLLGRSWKSADDFLFELIPYGKATYDDNGNISGVEETAKIPMPADDEERHSKTEGGKATTHALSNTTTVDPNGNLERLARFGAITYKAEDLVYNSKSKHMQGDFFYVMKEVIPGDAVNADGKKYEDATPKEKAEGGFSKDGITYDSDEHTVHVSVRENRTSALTVEIGYDESTRGAIRTGTQFTPVYTNKYTAKADLAVDVSKYIMGRDWKSGENGDYFDFDMTAMGGAPMVDANREKDFPEHDSGSDEDIEAALSQGKAAHTSTGAHRIRVKVTDTTKTVQTGHFPAILFTMDHLSVSGSKTERLTDEQYQQLTPEEQAKYTKDGNDWTRTYAVSTDAASGTESELIYSDGTDVIPGTRYGRFVYAVNEVKTGASDLNLDTDTEYARITVIDKGDGSLDYSIEMFEDRYCSLHRYMRVEDPDAGDIDKYYEYDSIEKKYSKATEPFDKSKTYYIEAKSTAFVDQLIRDISVTKAWAGTATEDVTLKLQWSVDAGEDPDGGHWYDASETAWLADALAGKGGQRTIEKNAKGKDLTLSCEGLPAYANIRLSDDMSGRIGDDVDLNDRWVYYRVVEITPQKADVRYNKTPYVTGDTIENTVKYSASPYHTEDEKDSAGHYTDESKRVKQLYVTNFPENISGEAQVGVVKQYIGKDWDNESFDFEITPVKSMIGDETEAVDEGDERIVEYINKTDGSTISVSEYNKLPDDEKANYYPVKTKNTMPSYGSGNMATASKTTSKVSVNERAANFRKLTIRRSDLAEDSSGTMRGTFFYKVKEIVPDGALKTNEVCGKDVDGNDVFYYAGTDASGNRIKYTTEEHMVKIEAVDDGSDKINTVVSFDDRSTGEYVPVFTNYAQMPTPVEGTKTWVGGAEDKHVNGTVALNDDKTKIESSSDSLGIKLKRTPDKKNAETEEITKDDTGRDLVIVWVKETRETITEKHYVNKTDSSDVINEEEYNKLDPEEKAKYEERTRVITTIRYESQTTGDGTFTVKAKDGDEYVDPTLNTTDKDGNKYVYSIEEGSIPEGYEASYKGMDVTNTNASGSTQVVVSKKWDDADDQDGKRPESVEVSITAAGWDGKDLNNKTVGKLTLSGDNNWKSVFKDLPEKDKTGNKYDYRITENDVPAEYTVSVKYQSAADKSWKTDKPADWNGKALVTNSYVPGRLSIRATKVWAGESNEIGTSLRSDVILHLYGKDENGLIVYDAGTKKISKDASSEAERTVSWNDIPKRHYKNEDLTWEVSEEPVYGYTTKISGSFTDGFTVTNTYAEPVTKVTAKKVWDDDNVWEDKAYTKRPEEVTFELWRKVGDSDPEKVSGSDKTVSKDTTKPWTAEWNNLPVVKKVELESETEKERTEYKKVQKTDEDGKLIFRDLQTQQEVHVTKAEAEAEDSQYKDTSKYEPVMTEEEVPVKEIEKVKDTKEVPILYTVKEVSIDDSHYAEPVYRVTAPGEFEVVNSYIKETINIPVKKIWNDSEDSGGHRPDNITISLKDNTHNKVVRHIELSAEDQLSEDAKDTWVHTFMGLPKYDEDGLNITYSVVEKKVLAYDTSITTDEESGGYIVTNTHNVGAKTSLTVTKKWEGDEDDKSDRTSVQMQLIEVIEGSRKAIGEPVTLKYDKDDPDKTMSYTWDNLDTIYHGKKGEHVVSYTVEEKPVKGYTSNVSDTKERYDEVTPEEGDNPKAKGWYVKDGDEYKAATYTSVKEDETYYEKHLTVTVTNTLGEIPLRGDVIYVDPKNPVGKNAMIVKSTSYRKPEEAKDAAEKRTDAPSDPKHKGVNFVGWDLNWDENGNYLLVATYSDIPTEVIPVTTYIDPQSNKPLLISKFTKDPSSVPKPKKPRHKNLQFVGWVKTVDAGGNTIFVAKYRADCANGAYSTGTGKGVKTGDSNQIVLWIATMFAAAALLSIYGEKRRRENRR